MKNIIAIVAIISLTMSCNSDDSTEPQVHQPEVNDLTLTTDERPKQGAVLGTVSATTSQGSLSFKLLASTPENAISIEETSGDVTVNNPDAFVFEDYPEIVATVEVSNESQTKEASITIKINKPEAKEPVIWSGQKISFVKEDGADPAVEAHQDRITDDVWLTRSVNGGSLYNAKVEEFSENGPAGTAWAEGTIDQWSTLTFADLKPALGGTGFKNLPGKTLVLHLVEEDIYLEVTFTSWSSGRDNGGFSYDRTTP